MEISRIENKLKTTGYSITSKRHIILQILALNDDKYLSTQELYQLTKDNESRIGISTIYRTLHILDKLNLLTKFSLNGAIKYQLTSLRHMNICHLICLNCDTILKVPIPDLDKLKQAIMNEYGFDITSYSLNFFGYCKKCSQEVKACSFT